MRTRELERAIAAADPVDPTALRGVDLEAIEAELLADLDGEQLAAAVPPGARPDRHRALRLRLAVGTAGLVALATAILLLAPGSSKHPSEAYGADLVRFAESSPLLLLEGPGWRVEDVNEERRREGIEGSVEFVTGRPIPPESIRFTTNPRTGRPEIQRPPAAVRQRQVALSWHDGSLRHWLRQTRSLQYGRWTTAPVLGATAHVNTRAELEGTGGPGDREMIALWPEGGHVLELRAAVPDLGAFEERLGWLTQVDLQTWLAAMPPQVVKAGDHDAVVREMLTGVPVPKPFSPSRVPDEGLIVDRSRVAGEVTSTVTCLWFRQWGDARRTGDRPAALEAERAIATAPRWPIVRQAEREGSSFELLLKLIKSMPTGVWQFGPHRWRLPPKAEGLGCARLGLPVLPAKMARQREHGVPPPPR